MRYLKTYNESKNPNDYYSLLSNNDIDRYTFMDISKSDIKKLSKMFVDMENWGFVDHAATIDFTEYFNRISISYQRDKGRDSFQSFRTKLFHIFSMNDEWYMVDIGNRKYLCDQWDGLMMFFKDSMVKVVANIDLETFGKSILTKGKIYDGVKIKDKTGFTVYIINDRGEREPYFINENGKGPLVKLV